MPSLGLSSALAPRVRLAARPSTQSADPRPESTFLIFEAEGMDGRAKFGHDAKADALSLTSERGPFLSRARMHPALFRRLPVRGGARFAGQALQWGKIFEEERFGEIIPLSVMYFGEIT